VPPAPPRRLKTLGLIVSPSRELLGRILPGTVMLLVLLLGVAKLRVGLSDRKPAEILARLCLSALVIACSFFFSRLHRSRRGDRALERLHVEHAGLLPLFRLAAVPGLRLGRLYPCGS